jgi:hypothetical protein
MARYMKSKANGVLFPFVEDLVKQGLADECDATGNLPGLPQEVPPPVIPLTGATAPAGEGIDAGTPGEPPQGQGNDIEAAKARIMAMERPELVTEAKAMGLTFQPNTGADKLRALILEAISGG